MEPVPCNHPLRAYLTDPRAGPLRIPADIEGPAKGLNRKDDAMNIHTPTMDRKPSTEQVTQALALLRQWAGKASDSEIAGVDAALG
jgi:hypothetical protein